MFVPLTHYPDGASFRVREAHISGIKVEFAPGAGEDITCLILTNGKSFKVYEKPSEIEAAIALAERQRVQKVLERSQWLVPVPVNKKAAA